ncbi:MAG: helix-turn-helix domain-containing protein [Streptosporangiales bacterium]|nr:helix-turn-helix domain-containing protein [Streptosporangiales bacterium]
MRAAETSRDRLGRLDGGLDFDACYRAIEARDARFDGRFYTGVTSTGVFCRPICPARTPSPKNVRFFRYAAVALAAGFRPCRRCRPEASPDSPDWDVRGDLIGRGLRLIAEGVVDAESVRGLASRLAVTERHLHRVFVAELGVGPLALARTRRVQLARRLLEETSMPVTDVAFASGFGSVRQFNASMLAAYGRPPRELRHPRRRPEAGDERAGAGVAELTMRLAYRPPLDVAAILGFLGTRAVPGVEEVADGYYARTVRTASGEGIVRLALSGPAAREAAGAPYVALTLVADDTHGIARTVARSRRLLDLDADPQAVGEVLARDPALAALVRRRPGIRLPGAFDGFELAVRAVLGQQVSVPAASTLAGRLVARLGKPLTRPVGRLTHLFPAAADVAEADLSGLGFPGSRGRTLRALAQGVAAGDLVLDGSADPAETVARLRALPGVGPWTAAYIAMRALRDPDAFPDGDLALLRALDRLGVPVSRSATWRPWRGYAAMHLWTWLYPPDPSEDPPDDPSEVSPAHSPTQEME